MKRSRKGLTALLWLAATVTLGGLASAADEPNDELVQMIVGLLSDNDRDARAMGLQQVREAATGPAATKRFAALLPKLSPDAQRELIAALADRGDDAARPAVLTMLKSADGQVRAAAVRALGSLGAAADVPLLVQTMATATGMEKTAARASLARLRGQTVNAAIVVQLKPARAGIRVELLDVLTARRAVDAVPGIMAFIDDVNAKVRMASMAALGKLAGPEHVADMLDGVLKAKPGPERDAAEKAVMFVCNRTADVNKRADPLLTAYAKLSDDDRRIVLPVLGRVGGAAALTIIETAIADKAARQRDAGIRALCNWPNATVAPQLIDLATTGDNATHRMLARRALIRVAALPDKRPDAERLALLKKAMTMATSDEERNMVLKRAAAIRTIQSLRFVVPYLDRPELAQIACATVVELAHHRKLREPNKAEFDGALDSVIRISKDPGVLDRANRYKKGQT